MASFLPKMFVDDNGCMITSSPYGIHKLTLQLYQQHIAENGWDNVQSVRVPLGVTTIRNHDFFICTRLKFILLPPLLEEIKSGAFTLCYQLECMYIPDSVKAIGDGAFISCTMLKIVSCPAAIDMSRIFVHCNKLECVYVRYTTDVYNALLNWNEGICMDRQKGRVVPTIKVNMKSTVLFEAFLRSTMELCEKNGVDDCIYITTDHIYPFLTI